MSIATELKTEQLIAELYKVEGKAEIINGEIVRLSPFAGLPARAISEIVFSLDDYSNRNGGCAFGSTVAFLVDLPHRKSFCADASYYTGPRAGMEFLPQAPDFAVELKHVGESGLKSEKEMAEKRADYFAAGTKVVWDVDLLSEEVVRVYRATKPSEPAVYRRGETAEAEPAVPGWKFTVDELFD